MKEMSKVKIYQKKAINLIKNENENEKEIEKEEEKEIEKEKENENNNEIKKPLKISRSNKK